LDCRRRCQRRRVEPPKRRTVSAAVSLLPGAGEADAPGEGHAPHTQGLSLEAGRYGPVLGALAGTAGEVVPFEIAQSDTARTRRNSESALRQGLWVRLPPRGTGPSARRKARPQAARCVTVDECPGLPYAGVVGRRRGRSRRSASRDSCAGGPAGRWGDSSFWSTAASLWQATSTAASPASHWGGLADCGRGAGDAVGAGVRR